MNIIVAQRFLLFVLHVVLPRVFSFSFVSLGWCSLVSLTIFAAILRDPLNFPSMFQLSILRCPCSSFHHFLPSMVLSLAPEAPALSCVRSGFIFLLSSEHLYRVSCLVLSSSTQDLPPALCFSLFPSFFHTNPHCFLSHKHSETYSLTPALLLNPLCLQCPCRSWRCASFFHIPSSLCILPVAVVHAL